jgi:hypothetical protein
LVETFNLMQQHPGGTLPDKLSTPADLRAFYRLCDTDDVTHEAIIAAARQYTLTRIADSADPVLIVHDATELDYTSLTSLADDLGQIGKGTHLGYICHNVLAVAADTGDVLGLVDQILHCRDELPENETLSEHRERESRESRLWLRGTEHLPADAKLIDVADQGSDTFEFLDHEFHSGRRFVVRACKVRKVYAAHQRTGADLRRCMASQRLVRAALDRRGISQSAKDGLSNRRHAVHDHGATGPSDCLAVRGGGDAAQPSRRQSPPGCQNTSGDDDLGLGLRDDAEPLALPGNPRRSDGP